MQEIWANLRLRIALIWRALEVDFSNFFLIEHRRCAGMVMSGKNSGTHWLRYMLNHAMAHRYQVTPPLLSSGRQAELFVGDPKPPRTHPDLPYLAASHNLPSVALSWRWLRWMFDLPPIVVLVRDPKQAMLSHIVKWTGPLALSQDDYVRKASTGRSTLANAWWYIDFFNRWGRMAASAPELVMIVRYEDLQAAPDFWLRRVSDHLGLGLKEVDVAAGLAVFSRESVRANLDPAYVEEVVPDSAKRDKARFTAGQEAVLDAQFNEFLRYDFGYGGGRRAASSALAPAGLTWARVGFVLALAYAAFNQFGRPYFGLTLGEPWYRLELAAAFCCLMALGPLSFPSVKGLLPILLPLGGAAVELAQHSGVAPGSGNLPDLMSEFAGLGVAGLVLLIVASARGPERHRADA